MSEMDGVALPQDHIKASKKKKGKDHSPMDSPKTRARRTRNKTMPPSSSAAKLADDTSDSDLVAQPSPLSSHSSSTSLADQGLGSSDSSTSSSSSSSSKSSAKKGRYRASTASTTSSPALLGLLNKSSVAPTPAPSPSLRGSPSTARRLLGLSRSPQPQRKKSMPPIGSSLPSSPSCHHNPQGRRWLDDEGDDTNDDDDDYDDDPNIFSPRVEDDDRAEDWVLTTFIFYFILFYIFSLNKQKLIIALLNNRRIS
jgi:hypothetical protein